MNNVDLIIKYLSGEMSKEEARSFEEDLAAGQGLKEEFDEVSVAYKLIRDQLQKKDEEEFKSRLLEVMGQPVSGEKLPGRSVLSRWYFLLAMAACLTLLLTIFLPQKSGEKLFSKYYHPDDDWIVLAYEQGTRGKAESGITHYQLGHFPESMEIMWEIIEQEPENQMALLYYLLSSIEVEKQDQAIEKMAAQNLSHNHQLGQALSWYTALALIKSGRPEEAIVYLHPLIQQQGPYQAEARRLEKILLK